MRKCLDRVMAFGLCLGMIWMTGMQAGEAEPALDAKMQTLYKDAYGLMTKGEPYAATVQLIELLRTVPGDDVQWADALIGPSQLLGFSVASLLDWPQRSTLLEEVLQPDTYPTDALLIAALKAGSGVQSMALPAQMTLKQLGEGKHLAVKAAALYILGQPYYYSGSHMQSPAMAELVLNYPNLEFSRCLVEIPVYNTLSKALEEGVSEKNLLGEVLYWGGRKEQVLQASSGLSKAAEALPTMNFKALDDTVIQKWAASLEGEETPHSRYTLVSLLSKSCTTPKRRAAAQSALAAVAERAPASPDILRARMLLADFAQKEHDVERPSSLSLNLLKLDLLPCTAERSMYEATMHTVQHTARYYTRYGFVKQALQLHEALASKFPNSTLAESETKQAKALRENGLEACLDLIATEVNAPLRNGDTQRVIDTYSEIIAHTQNTSLRNILQKKRSQLEVSSSSLQTQTTEVR